MGCTLPKGQGLSVALYQYGQLFEGFPQTERGRVLLKEAHHRHGEIGILKWVVKRCQWWYGGIAI